MKDGLLSSKYKEALEFAFDLHKNQLRKGISTPYMTHILSVSSLVMENGGDEEQAIAGLLHDSIEDQSQSFGGADVLRAEIRRRFGPRVLEIVERCTDAETIPKPPWRERKEKYIERIAREPAYVRLVSLADKVHNARSILTDYRALGDDLWSRFTGKKEGLLWYYRSLCDVFLKTDPDMPLALEFDRVVKEIESL